MNPFLAYLKDVISALDVCALVKIKDVKFRTK